MADYHAVLQRTLAGFTDPKPELRFKLYERARTTIARQLENRTPAVTGDALTAELDKLEYAIFEIERGFDPSYLEPAPKAAAPSPPVEEVAPPVDEAPAPVQGAVASIEEVVLAAPVPPQAPTVPKAPVEQQSFTETLATTPAANEQPVAPTAAEAPPPQLGFEPLEPPSAAVDPAVEHVQPTVAPEENQAINDAAVDQWAEQFLSHQSGGQAAPAADPVATLPAADAENPLPLPAELQQQPQTQPSHDPSWDAAPQNEPASEAYQPLPPLPTFKPHGEPAQEDPLVIPPAPGFGNGGSKRPRKRKWLKWLILLLVLILLGGGATYGWLNKEQILEQVGMSDLLDSPTRPKPVKTISITPPPQTPEAPLPAPKVESRLNSDGEEVAISDDTPSPSPELQPVIETPAATQPADGTVPIAQNAIFYEEGATPAENTVDAGRVVWSIIEEEPASGASKELAISARIEIPGRDIVLIMKIKRNADKALPASHLIELVFAVPDDFSGGAIGQVSRFVLKQSEQGRGEGLVGVPTPIADGIFWIALNNLEQARQKNESLLKSRDWIDIPLQYRTGRHALVTIEKGIPGAQVFDEVFEAWSKL